jgi:tripartite-type tricarboxylate transporter receptor subunit TctC
MSLLYYQYRTPSVCSSATSQVKFIKGKYMKILSKIFLATAFSITSLCQAQPIEIITPFPPGGTVDHLARYVQKVLTTNGIGSIVVHKPGAQGAIAIRHAKESQQPAILMMSAGPGLITPLVNPDADWNLNRDFQPISLLAKDVMAISVPSDRPWNNLQDLLAALKKSPGQLTHGNASDINRLGALMFLQKTNNTGISVNFQGGSQTVIALAGGHVDFIVLNYADVKSIKETGKIKVLGLADRQRHAFDKSIPTLKEQGLDLDISTWYGMLGTKNMDPALVKQINELVVSAMRKDREFTYLHNVLIPTLSSPKEFHDFYDQQIKLWRPVAANSR